MRFVVEDRVFEAIPGLRVLAFYAPALSYTPEQAAQAHAILQRHWSAAAESAKSLPNVQSHPNLKAWRDCFQSLGISVKKFVCSAESLVKRASKQPEARSINPYVDFYNALSVGYAVPFGAFDVDAFDKKDLELRYCRDTDTFQALDEEEAAKVAATEIAYVVGSQVTTRHINWKQSRLGLVTEASRNVLFMSEILSAVPEPQVQELVREFREQLGLLFGRTDCKMAVLSRSSPVFEF